MSELDKLEMYLNVIRVPMGMNRDCLKFMANL